MHLQSNNSSLTITSQQIMQKLFISEPDPTNQTKDLSRKHLRINLKLLKKISQQTHNYRTAIQLLLILERILYTGNKRLSLRQLIYRNSTSFRNHNYQKSFNLTTSSFASQGSQTSNHSATKEKQPTSTLTQKSKESIDSTTQKQNNNTTKQQQYQQVTNIAHDAQIQQPHLFISDQLNRQQKKTLIQCLNKIKHNLSNTIYQSKINFIIDQLQPTQKQINKKNITDQEIYKKIIVLTGLGLEGNKNTKIQEFINKGYQILDGKFNSFQSLYTFISNQVLPLIQRKILSISITNHTQRQSFICKAITFLSEYFLHQFILQIKINKATLIENRIFIQKILKQNFKKHQSLIMNNLTNIINQALLCPSNIQIQLPLFRLLKRMYYLWGITTEGSSQFIQIKNDQQNLSQFIKYPLLLNLKNISLYSKPVDNQDQIKQPAMFCYKILNAKQDLYLSNQIQTLSQLRYIKQSKYFSSKAYAFSDQISRIYDTFDLRLNLWKYYKRIQRGQIWTYNVLIQKPNSLLIWQFYLQGFDIGFGIYKVESFRKHTIQEYNKQVQCKEILKFQKCTVTQAQPQKGFLFLKNGLYKIVFDNTYSSFRGKDLSYMILHLESEN